jgi:hypothetical protein
MNEFVSFFLIIIAIFIIINKELEKNKEIEKVKSTKDGIIYLVRKLPDSNVAANKLAEINERLLKLIENLDKEKEGVMRIVNKYSPNNLSETKPGSLYRSYSVNKGEQIAICLRDPKDNSFEDMNTIIFVVIHEISHVMTESIGHDETFWNNMKYLLMEAEKIGVYNPIDYSMDNVKYCGMDVKSTPYDFKK